MPRSVILIISRDEITIEDKTRMLDKIPKGIEYDIIEAREREDVKSTATLINDSHCDVVLCGKDITLSPWEVADQCSAMASEKTRPVFVIDGEIENILDREFNRSTFSGAVGVVKHEQAGHTDGFKFERAYKEAHDHVPNVINTRFNIASNTKMMTSIAIAIDLCR